MSDVELLNQHRDGSQTAFADIVRRHLGWVYGVARRRLRDAQLAEDVAQAVFMLLHRKAPHFAGDGAMIRWLHQTAWYATEAAARTERRRRRLETEVATMNSLVANDTPGNEDWRELAPLLDELIEKLPQVDREMVLLHYYRDLSFSEIGQQLGTSEEAARKRVSRAVEKLREFARGKVVEISAGALATGLGQFVHLAAPAGLVAQATTAALAPAGSALAGGGASILKGMVFMSTSTKISVAAVFVVLLIIGATIFNLYLPSGNPSHVSDTFIAKPQAAVTSPRAVSGRGFPTQSPYSNLKWDGDKPQVQYNGTWYELAALNDIPAAQIVAFCQKSYGNIWQKRFGEDLVEVLSAMGKPAGSDVSLRLISPDTKAITDVPHAAMTEANRQALWTAVNGKTFGGTGYARLAPYSGVRWNGKTPQVKVGADWFELVAIDDVPASQIVAFSEKTYGNIWQKRFEEDLVEVFTVMGKPLGDSVKLDLRSLDGATASVVQAKMTAENRRAILIGEQGRTVARP